jgi:hypothetical protein
MMRTGRGLISLVVLLVPVAFVLRAINRPGGGTDILVVGLVLAPVAVGALVWIVAWRSQARNRNRALATLFPLADLIPAARSRDLVLALNISQFGDAPFTVRAMTRTITLVVVNGNMEIWGGSGKEPALYVSIPLAEVLAVRASSRYGVRGLELDLRDKPDPLKMHVILANDSLKLGGTVSDVTEEVVQLLELAVEGSVDKRS